MPRREVTCPHCREKFAVRIPTDDKYSRLPIEQKRRSSARAAVHCYLGFVIRDAIDAPGRIRRDPKTVDAWLKRRVRWGSEEFLERMIETLPPGMHLSDWHTGALQIDHIRPFATFDTGDTVQDIRDAFQLDNLRMLHTVDNLTRNKYHARRET